MGVQHTYGTTGATGGGYSAQHGTLQPSFEELTVRFPVNNWQCRSPRTWKDRNKFVSLWSYGCRIGYGMPSGSDGVTSNRDMTYPDLFEPFSCDGEGSQTLKFIKGSAVDASNVAISGANIRAFRASDNSYAGYTVQSRTDGSYDVPTNFPGVAHFIDAYIAGSPDRGGTTLNTLTPTNIDGT